MLPWLIGATFLAGTTLGVSTFIRQSLRDIPRHNQGLAQITRSLIQPISPFRPVPVRERGGKRSYRYGGHTISLTFISHYRKARRRVQGKNL